MIADLIYDIGMCDGNDTCFYMKKGFRVVAIEANPDLVDRAQHRFAAELATGQLTLLNVAISDDEGSVPFYVSRKDPGWSTISPGFAQSMATRRGGRFDEVRVRSSRLESIIATHGVPYYMKIDIEGVDIICLHALHAFDDRPRYVSVEMPNRHDWDALAQHHYADLCHLFLLGYRGFKIMDQTRLSRIVLPRPAREGLYAPHEFTGHSTGPFGAETPGKWLSFDGIVPAYRSALSRTEPAWFDLHAVCGDEIPSAPPRDIPRTLARDLRAIRATLRRRLAASVAGR
jgi:FkbM family methyltransferase